MGKIVLRNKMFKAGVNEVDGVISIEHGYPMFYSESEGILANIPCFIGAESYGLEATALIYPMTNQIILDLGKDDLLLSDFKRCDLDVFSDFEFIRSKLEEEKLKNVPLVLPYYASVAIALIILLVMLLLRAWRLAPIPIVFFLVGVLGIRYYTKILNSTRVYDRVGNWVDVSSGETSLNDSSVTIPL